MRLIFFMKSKYNSFLAGLVLCVIFIIISCKHHKYAKIKFEKDEILFSANKGEKVVATYQFRNDGKDSLAIISANGTCNCTDIQYPGKPIAPGDTASLTVNYNSAYDSAGGVIKRVLVESNTDPILTILVLKGILK